MQLLAKNRDKKIKKYENTISETQTNIDKVFKEIGIHDTEVKEKQNLIKNKDSNEKRLKETLTLEKQKLETAKKKQTKMYCSFKNTMIVQYVNKIR